MNYAFVVGATYSYTPELCALLNSLDYVGNKADVHVLGIELKPEFTDQFSKLNYRVILHDIPESEWQPEGGRSEIVCRKRYWYAAEFGKDYDAVCVLDADLVFCRDPLPYFEIAAKTGFILGPCKEQNKVYNDPHHQFNGEWLIPEGYYNDKDMCNCPVFIDAKKWETPLRNSWLWFLEGRENGTNMKCPDMDCMNIAFIKYAGRDNLLTMAGNQWLGTNEQHLKPYIRAVNMRGMIQTESGIPIFSYHGQYYKEKWRKQQLENRHGCARGYLKAAEESDSLWASDNIAQGSINLLYENFMRMLDYKIKIEKKDYQNV